MSDYSFMKSGFGDDSDNISDEEMQQNMIAVVLTFTEGAIKTAGKYTVHSGRKGVTPEDLKRAMMLEMFFFKKRPGIVEQAEKIKQELFTEEEEEELDEPLAMSDEDLEEFTESTCECALCKCMNTVYGRWENWQPQSRMEKLFKTHIGQMC